MTTIEQRGLLHFAVVAITLMSIVCHTPAGTPIASPTTIASTIATAATEVHVGHAHKNMAAYENGFTAGHHYQPTRHQRQPTPAGDSLYYSHQHYDKTNSRHGNGMTKALVALTASPSPSPSSSSSSSASSASGDGSTTSTGGFYNGLTNLSGLRHISSNDNGYGYSYGQSATAAASAGSTDALAKSYSSTAKQQIPIYEEQHEDEHTATGYAGENNQHTVNAFIPSAYHNNFIPLSNAAWEGYQAKATIPYYQQQQQQHEHEQQQQQQYERQQRQFQQQSNDKISDGNFQHHYEHNSGYNGGLNEHSAASPSSAYSTYSSPTSTAWHFPSSPSSSGYSAHAPDAQDDGVSQSFAYDHFPQYPSNHHHQLAGVEADDITADGDVNDDNNNDDDDDNDPSSSPNYLTHHAPQEEVQHHTNVINYIPYPVVKKQHIPVRAPVQIPISHAVIVPVSKPVPIQIPVTQQVQVPVEKELKIPIERVVPYPVEKHIPVPVEKRVPYPVVRYVPVKVNRPFPVKVPVYKTILHKVKGAGWW